MRMTSKIHLTDASPVLVEAQWVQIHSYGVKVMQNYDEFVFYPWHRVRKIVNYDAEATT